VAPPGPVPSRASTGSCSEPSGGKTVVYLITMRGHFIAQTASVPAGARLPAGSYLSVVINARTFAVMDWGVSRAAPASPASLGPMRGLKA
jgi:hypothetical protein